jgi:hypothetical protein
MLNIPISLGELLDKLSILHIKKQKISEPTKLSLVTKEYELLHERSQVYLNDKDLFNLYDDLIITNSKLWNIEDEIRVCEKNKKFDDKFIELARAVYFTNDERFEIKNKINQVAGSETHSNAIIHGTRKSKNQKGDYMFNSKEKN